MLEPTGFEYSVLEALPLNAAKRRPIRFARNHWQAFRASCHQIDSDRPAAIIGCPVGFVGAAESKDALMEDLPVPSMIVRGRLGGSAITVAAVNALASFKE